MEPPRLTPPAFKGLLLVLAALALALPFGTAARTLAAPARLSAADIYAYAGECMALRNTRMSAYVGRDLFGYVLKPRAADAVPFRMQATDLGSFMLYGPDGSMPSVALGQVVPTSVPGPAADWKLSTDGYGLRITSLAASSDLVSNWLSRLAVSRDDDGSQWSLEPATGCAAFPEAEVNIDGTPPPGASPTAEVHGFLDAHVHLTAFDFLGGKFHCGRPWSRYGITDALKDCPDHAFNGVFALAENLLSHGTLFATHSNEGWPDFDGWPAYDSLTHEGTYWKAVERAWRGGLRAMVSDLVENRALCEIYPLKQNPCTDMDSLRLQARDLYKLQDYIDAQSKGPGKGFFRIVKSPAEARAVINQGKLAVVMGVETSQPFDCLYQRGVEICSEQQIDRGLRELWDLGVRSLFPVHKFDNAFGGAAMDDGVAGILVNAGNKWMTGNWWQVEACAGSDHDHSPQSLAFAPSAATTSAVATVFSGRSTGSASLYSNLLEAVADGPLPYYSPGEVCNVRGLTKYGEYLVKRMIDMGMIVETDHMSVKTRARALQILEARGYSGVITSHSWGDPGSTLRLQALGGIVAPHVNDGREAITQEWQTAKAAQPAQYYFGLGYGTDTNGISTQAAPRDGALANNPVTYPFQSIDGRSVSKNRWGNRVWDVNLDGAAQYGMYPDWVEDLRHVSGQGIVDDLARGAEAYLQMWSRAYSVRR
jgi:microsomal dipeptidase-like Zn-dependent dipeptidase